MKQLMLIVVGMSMIWWGIIAIIEQQHEYYPDLAALMMPPDGCEMPCFLGIRLGETRADDAVAILEAHSWVSDVQYSGVGDRQTGSIRWRWSFDAPIYFNSFRDNVLSLDYQTEVVTGITLRLDHPTADVWRMAQMTVAGDGMPLSTYLRVDTPNCIYDPLQFWSHPSQRVFYTSSPVRRKHNTIYHSRRDIPIGLICER